MHSEAPEPLLQFFRFTDLPTEVQSVARRFADLALALFDTLPRNVERTTALRNLLASRDNALRAAVLADFTATDADQLRREVAGLQSP